LELYFSLPKLCPYKIHPFLGGDHFFHRLKSFIHRKSSSYPQVYPLMYVLQLFYGSLLGATIGALAWRAGSLSASGAVAAAVVGGLVFGLGGLQWASLLLLFFISSSVWSRAFRKQKANLNEKFSKGSRRNWEQVLANGGLSALLAIAYAVWGEPRWAFVAFAGAMAAVNADTWATELGVLSAKSPRLITTGQLVEKGTSGAISREGNLAVLGGAGLIGIVAGLVSPQSSCPELCIAIFLGGISGALFDSVLGASLQAIFFCPTCQKQTERHPHHTCQSQTVYLRGWRWMNNELVNFACSVVGAGVATGLWLVIFQ
jgi:uncharacterized protein (TIGR00297 family)